MYALCYQFLVIFRCLGIFPLERNGFVTFIIPGSRDIVQVAQTVQIDLQKFRFTEPGSNLVFVLKNSAHNFCKIQKGNVITFYKIIQLITLYRFVWGSLYYYFKISLILFNSIMQKWCGIEVVVKLTLLSFSRRKHLMRTGLAKGKRFNNVTQRR